MVIELDDDNVEILREAKRLIDRHLKENALFVNGETIIPMRFDYELLDKIRVYCDEHNMDGHDFIHEAIHDKLQGE